MRHSLHLRSPLPLLAVLALGACAAGAPRAAAPTPIARSEEAAIADSVRRSATPADVQFMSGMIGHHAQAIVMGRMAETHGASGAIRILAGRVINAQTDEIALMQRWLRSKGQPVPEAVPGMRMVMDGHEHQMLMPGMLTERQMAELDAARGTEFDRLFLTYMIQHHEGAIAMVQELLSHPGAAQDDVVFKFASDVNVDQATEVARMRRMLFDLTVNAAGP